MSHLFPRVRGPEILNAKPQPLKPRTAPRENPKRTNALLCLPLPPLRFFQTCAKKKRRPQKNSAPIWRDALWEGRRFKSKARQSLPRFTLVLIFQSFSRLCLNALSCCSLFPLCFLSCSSLVPLCFPSYCSSCFLFSFISCVFMCFIFPFVHVVSIVFCFYFHFSLFVSCVSFVFPLFFLFDSSFCSSCLSSSSSRQQEDRGRGPRLALHHAGVSFAP